MQALICLYETIASHLRSLPHGQCATATAIAAAVGQPENKVSSVLNTGWHFNIFILIVDEKQNETWRIKPEPPHSAPQNCLVVAAENLSRPSTNQGAKAVHSKAQAKNSKLPLETNKPRPTPKPANAPSATAKKKPQQQLATKPGLLRTSSSSIRSKSEYPVVNFSFLFHLPEGVIPASKAQCVARILVRAELQPYLEDAQKQLNQPHKPTEGMRQSSYFWSDF